MNSNQSLTAVVSKGTIQIGRDFVEAVTGTKLSHGSIELRRGTNDPMLYSWESTQGIASTERSLRATATREKLRVTAFQSQAL